MKKIIAALDGLKYSESTTEYAIHLAKQANTHLVGIFLDDFTYHSYKIYELVGEEERMEKKQARLNRKDELLRAQSVNYFTEACEKAGLNFSVRHDRNIALQDLLHESMYADLLIISRSETLTHYEESIPTHFVRNLLVDVQCPVLLVPEQFKPIENIMLLYDGGPSSLHAIKMFSYMFPALKQLGTEVLCVKNDAETMHVPDNKLMKEFMKRHFRFAHYTVLKGAPEIEIVKYIRQENKSPMIVLGAYRRGMVSRWFKASMADVLMTELKAPLFIAHNK